MMKLDYSGIHFDGSTNVLILRLGTADGSALRNRAVELIRNLAREAVAAELAQSEPTRRLEALHRQLDDARRVAAEKAAEAEQVRKQRAAMSECSDLDLRAYLNRLGVAESTARTAQEVVADLERAVDALHRDARQVLNGACAKLGLRSSWGSVGPLSSIERRVKELANAVTAKCGAELAELAAARLALNLSENQAEVRTLCSDFIGKSPSELRRAAELAATPVQYLGGALMTPAEIREFEAQRAVLDVR
jgi:hypothetical protein